ncbi:MAG: S-methyl-5-thioribose-1-phosphate isomerase [Gammaproteobacteria bacterium]
MQYKSIDWITPDNVVRILDQRLLPATVKYRDYTDARGVARAITDMVIRGAPAIGAAAAYGVAVQLWHDKTDDLEHLQQSCNEADELLRCSRPTAVNLSWALDRIQARLAVSPADSADALRQRVLSEAHAIAEQDVAINKSIGGHALELVPERATVIHHCNTGSLATVGYGTALGIIRTAHEQGRDISVLVDETRPRLQGARLTCWELQQMGIPHRLIVDAASGYYMQQGQVDFCVVGCDRVAANGDTANKIGTYNLALVARANDIPFYVAAPGSSIDLSTACGRDIAIEQRPADEITHIGKEQITPAKTPADNPAFDITPADCISAIITEKGIIRPPYKQNLAALFG